MNSASGTTNVSMANSSDEASDGRSAVVKIQSISDELFAPFGHAHAAPKRPVRVDYSAAISSLRADAAPSLYTTFVPAREAPIEVTLLERHRYSSQTFLPLGAEGYLIIVALSLPDGTPDVSTVRAFRVPGNRAITYAAGTWHHPMIALGQDAGFAVMMWLDGGPDDEEYFSLDRHFLVGDG